MDVEFVSKFGPWLGGMSALIASSMALVSFSYETFETKDTAKERLQAIEKRLERIENKIDAITDRERDRK